jgi:hypothetical protein
MLIDTALTTSKRFVLTFINVLFLHNNPNYKKVNALNSVKP